MGGVVYTQTEIIGFVFFFWGLIFLCRGVLVWPFPISFCKNHFSFVEIIKEENFINQAEPEIILCFFFQRKKIFMNQAEHENLIPPFHLSKKGITLLTG